MADYDECFSRSFLRGGFVEKDRPKPSEYDYKQLPDDPIYDCVEKSVSRDQNNFDQHEPGVKLDEGKPIAGVLGDFSLALMEVAKVGTFGAKKYSRGGWQYVKNGHERYTDAMWRHLLEERHNVTDKDSGCRVAAQVAWNALARLELEIRKEKGISE